MSYGVRIFTFIYPITVQLLRSIVYITKTCLFKYIEILQPKKEMFQIKKKTDIFFFFFFFIFLHKI